MMKMNGKKKTAVVALILCILSILSLSTLAWFTDSDDLTNTIQFVNDFEMDLYETDDEGETITDDSGNTIGKTYENVLPGQELHKDPTVINKSSTASQYIRMTVTFTQYQGLTDAGIDDIKSLLTDLNTADWTVDDGVAGEGDTFVITAYLNEALEPGATAMLFTCVKIPDLISNTDVSDRIGDSFDIVVHADAIQSDHLPDGVDSAEAAFALIDG